MYEQLFRKAFFPLFEGPIKRRNTHVYLEQYERSQWLKPAALEAQQLEKLNAVLDHSWRHVPFLREHWSGAGLRPGNLTRVADLRHFPLLDKTLIKDNYEKMRSSGLVGRVFSKTTGGSTGDPFRFEYSQESYARRTAVMWRGYRWCGTDLGRRTAYVWGASMPAPGLRGLKDRLYHSAFNRLILNSFEMTESNLHWYAEQLQRFAPRVVVGYVAPLRMLAQWANSRGLQLCRPDTVITGAEPLTGIDREIIGRAFEAPVHNTYGCREVMLLACECAERSGLHVSADHLIVETVDGQGRPLAGESGDVCITDFHNYAMPMIRYLNGDRATSTDRVCACGRGLPLLESVDGRILDVIVSPDGRTVPGEYFVYVMLDFADVRQWQVVQKSRDAIEVLIAHKQPLTSDERERMSGKIAARMGPLVRIEIKEVSDIPLTASGKRRVTVSQIASPTASIRVQ
ncbi:MAG: phenylacetate--CoA ligase family protein [Pseudomonadota bacterium]